MRGSGKADVFAMLAHPVGHAKSPGMFNALMEQEGLDSLMVPVTCKPEHFDTLWAGLSAMENLRGMVISVPFKQRAYQKCATAHPRAERVGAANTVIRGADGRWHADNFDGVGFMDGLAQAGISVRGQSVLQVGAGGAGASLAYCLAEAGAGAVTISDIDPARAETLAGLVAQAFPECDVSPGPPDPRGCEIAINATPMGLRADDPYPLDIEGLRAGMTVVDIIMDPRETPLLKYAAELGCRVQYGQPMMDCQMAAMRDCLGVLNGPKP
ncbi:shikimate dehydrogenase [Roseovarius spongiae]|uniref:Shikimate dehydrogenase n=1 Tax=Roseovarius spongiae TaxID=2320272 RepID=A0A3A8AXV3_9RHOB|nr:shikimate dehydrogenase [Roseovarius spongiae]RKF16606.1 shikimate dehydrogenase [Roseovarius spongiae]